MYIFFNVTSHTHFSTLNISRYVRNIISKRRNFCISTQNTAASKATSSPAQPYKAFHLPQQSIPTSYQLHTHSQNKAEWKRGLTYRSGSTFIFGITSLNFISFFPTLRQFRTGSMRLRRLYDCTTPWDMDACETNIIDVEGTNVFRC